ncbi:MAG: radical SAM protein [Deltaproteobacteria bacterium]|nr:radical SAM protein [Deltaproteobacteria bacterium]
MDLTYGPVPSRRLGRSLGINNIPPKICSYACVYCQLGKTIKMQIERQEFYPSQKILRSVQERVAQIHSQGETIDYLAFVPDGEPTLDIHLGRDIDSIKLLGIPVAVISNGSLIADPKVRRELSKADWVSLKVDSITEAVWRAIDRPHGKLNLHRILDGMLAFKEEFRAKLVTETMLIRGMNDSETSARETAHFLNQLKPDIAYISIPTRPPALKDVRPADAQAVNMVYQIFAEALAQVELLTGYEGNAFSSTGDVRQDILTITAVHPMRRDAIESILRKESADWNTIEQLLKNGEIIQSEFEGHSFFLRSFK